MDAPRRTKLVCTLGPASAALVDDLVAAGMDVARVNFSHGTPADHEQAVRAVRSASTAADRCVAVMVDLSGPKIRLGALSDDELTLAAGSRFVLRPRSGDPGTADGAPVSYPALARDVRVGDRILLADGAAELRVTATDGTVETEVVRGGTVRSRAGVAIPADRLSEPPLTPKDIADLPRIRALGVDYVAQSFIRRAEDVVALRHRLGPDGPPIVAKIETGPAVDDFDRILDVVDAVMIARGDLGLELPFEDVPVIQKELVRAALDHGVPSIVATQMLESMITSPRPTRAEASDVANAVFDGADAIMLSGETAIGAHPLLAAEAAVRIARACETHGAALLPSGMATPPGDGAGPLAVAAVALANADQGIAAIACLTPTGRSARLLSSLRPPVPIIAFSSDPNAARRLALAAGVVPRVCPPLPAGAAPGAVLVDLLGADGPLAAGASVVLLAASGELGSGPDLLTIHRVPAA
jgi:pyruvate kinase